MLLEAGDAFGPAERDLKMEPRLESDGVAEAVVEAVAEAVAEVRIGNTLKDSQKM